MIVRPGPYAHPTVYGVARLNVELSDDEVHQLVHLLSATNATLSRVTAVDFDRQRVQVLTPIATPTGDRTWEEIWVVATT